MSSINLVCEFSNLNMNEALELPHDTFLLIQRNAIIKNLNSTKQGRESLKLWKIYNITTPDYGKIRKNNFYSEG